MHRSKQFEAERRFKPVHEFTHLVETCPGFGGRLQKGTRFVDSTRQKIEFRARGVTSVVARREVALYVTKDVA